jgi:hypothetical protein
VMGAIAMLIIVPFKVYVEVDERGTSVVYRCFV